MKKIILFALLLLGGFSYSAHAQKVALKTNVLYDATTTANLGLEFGMGQRWTFDISGNLNAWNAFGETRFRHWMVQPELRFWFCDRFNGHFLGLHGIGGKYNFAKIPNNIKFLGTDLSPLTDYRFQGWGAGAGLAYGYSIILSRHLNLEFELGAGYIYTRFDKFECKDCGKKLEENKPHHYVGPTKAAINLVVAF